jgi:hypothetical protein
MKKVIKIDYHRNGVCGTGFFVVIFNHESDKNMVATIFPEIGSISVLKIDLLAKKNIEFGENSWRGDTYEHWLRGECEKWTALDWDKKHTYFDKK